MVFNVVFFAAAWDNYIFLNGTSNRGLTEYCYGLLIWLDVGQFTLFCSSYWAGGTLELNPLKRGNWCCVQFNLNDPCTFPDPLDLKSDLLKLLCCICFSMCMSFSVQYGDSSIWITWKPTRSLIRWTKRNVTFARSKSVTVAAVRTSHRLTKLCKIGRWPEKCHISILLAWTWAQVRAKLASWSLLTISLIIVRKCPGRTV